MGNPNDVDPREELCKRFRNDLKRPISDRYYSQDELVAIFDYAGDQADDYLRTEALLLGARLYPDSQDLLDRRAIYYKIFDDDTANKFIDDNQYASGILWDILQLDRLNGSKQQIIEQIENFINRVRLDEDEQVIQFVKVISHHELQQWLIDNIELLKSKCNYLPTLFYEIVVDPALDDNHVIRIRLLEELTELEPYNADYWTMLAALQVVEEQFDEARTSIDYALAIEPSHIEALKLRLRLLPEEEVDAEADRLLDLAPDDADMAMDLILKAEFDEDNERIKSILSKTLPHCKGSLELVSRAINSGVDGIEEIVTDLYAAGCTSSSDWEILAETAYGAGRLILARKLIEMYKELSGQEMDDDFLMIRILYQLGQYDLVVKTFLSAQENGSIRQGQHFVDSYTIMVLALLRSGEIDTAFNAATTVLQMLELTGVTPGNEVEIFGIRTFLKDVLKRIKSKKPTDWSTYDPIGLDMEDLESDRFNYNGQ